MGRMNFCKWFLEQPEDFHKSFLWSDEKLWVQKPHPDKKNEKLWAQGNAHYEVECKQQGGRCIVSWAGLINGRVIIHWFDVGATNNQEVFLYMMKNDIWLKMKSSVARRKDWIQQDKPTVYTALRVRQLLAFK